MTTSGRSVGRVTVLVIVAFAIAAAEFLRRFAPRPHLRRQAKELAHELVDPWKEAVVGELVHDVEQVAADGALVGVYAGDRLWRRRHRS